MRKCLLWCHGSYINGFNTLLNRIRLINLPGTRYTFFLIWHNINGLFIIGICCNVTPSQPLSSVLRNLHASESQSFLSLLPQELLEEVHYSLIFIPPNSVGIFLRVTSKVLRYASVRLWRSSAASFSRVHGIYEERTSTLRDCVNFERDLLILHHSHTRRNWLSVRELSTGKHLRIISGALNGELMGAFVHRRRLCAVVATPRESLRQIPYAPGRYPADYRSSPLSNLESFSFAFLFHFSSMLGKH